MGLVYLALSIVFYLGGIAGWIFLLVEAFRDELWKGVLGLLCGLYLIYWSVFDWEHEHKWSLIILAFGGTAIATGIANLA